ncbi:paramyosin-like, partial [Symsagittifera roscoffensis]|uniref:paramyosin-like n=1 Tax=Symsagittifera roscoffensis TaxID=84072 RepID=UPI00307C33D7
MDSFQPIGNVTANETDTAYALRAIGQSLSETESETIELRSSLQKLLNSDDNLEQTRSRISDIDNSIRYHENKSSPKDSIQNYSNLSVFTKMQCEDIQKAYQNLATKLTNTESTVQSLKLHFCNIQAKQDLKEKAVAFQKPDELNSSKSARADSKTRDVFENELKKVTKELDRYKEDLHIANNAKQKLKEENKSLMTQIELNHAARLNDSTRIEKLENAKNKCNRKVAEMKSQLDREVEVRQSLEKSHGSLMNRLQDMEQLIDQERAQVISLTMELSRIDSKLCRDNVVTSLRRQVQKVESECQSLKRDYVSLRSE